MVDWSGCSNSTPREHDGGESITVISFLIVLLRFSDFSLGIFYWVSSVQACLSCFEGKKECACVCVCVHTCLKRRTFSLSKTSHFSHIRSFSHSIQCHIDLLRLINDDLNTPVQCPDSSFLPNFWHVRQRTKPGNKSSCDTDRLGKGPNRIQSQDAKDSRRCITLSSRSTSSFFILCLNKEVTEYGL